MTLSTEIWHFGYFKTSVMSDLIEISGNDLRAEFIGETENLYLADNMKCKYK